jgi:hypothetical protein
MYALHWYRNSGSSGSKHIQTVRHSFTLNMAENKKGIKRTQQRKEQETGKITTCSRKRKMIY